MEAIQKHGVKVKKNEHDNSHKEERRLYKGFGFGIDFLGLPLRILKDNQILGAI